jgi:hypothetical protein
VECFAEGGSNVGYIDPGSFGLISQIGYMILFTCVTWFILLTRPVRGLIARFFRMLRPNSTAKKRAESPVEERMDPK